MNKPKGLFFLDRPQIVNKLTTNKIQRKTQNDIDKTLFID